MKTAASYIKKKYDCYKDYSEKQIRDVCHIWCEVIEEAQNDVKKEYEEKVNELLSALEQIANATQPFNAFENEVFVSVATDIARKALSFYNAT